MFTSSNLTVYYEAKIYGDACGFQFSVYLLNEIRINSILMKRIPHEEGQAAHEEDHHEDEIQHTKGAHHSVGYAEQ